MAEQLLDLVIPTGSSAAILIGVLAYLWKQRTKRDEEIEGRLRDQELKCEGTSKVVLTRLDGLDRLQQEQNKKIDSVATDMGEVKSDLKFLTRWARNGGNGAGG